MFSFSIDLGYLADVFSRGGKWLQAAAWQIVQQCVCLKWRNSLGTEKFKKMQTDDNQKCLTKVARMIIKKDPMKNKKIMRWKCVYLEK